MLLLEGDPDAAMTSAAKAMSLSPLDPIGYAMRSVQVISKIALEDFGGAGKLANHALQ